MEPEKDTLETRASRAYIAAFSFVGLSVFAYALIEVAAAPFRLDWLLFSVVTIAVASRTEIRIPGRSSTVTLSDTFLFISVLHYGVLPSVVLAGFDAASSSLHYKNRRKVAPFNTAVMSLSVFLSGVLITAFFGETSALNGDARLLIGAAGLLGLVHFLLNSCMIGLVGALRQGRSFAKTWREMYLWASVQSFTAAAAAAAVTKMLTLISFYAFIIAAPFLALIYQTSRIYLEKVMASIKHAEQVAEMYLKTIGAMAMAIGAKDQVSHDHVHRMQIYALGLGRYFKLSESEMEALKAGALLHDIGKLAVPDYILHKTSPLSASEAEKLKSHTIVGAEIIGKVQFPFPVVPAVKHHHEQWDGRGYPDGLQGEQIPITARILATVDCYETAMDQAGIPRESAIALLLKGSGAVFDPAVVSCFLEHLLEFEAEMRAQGIDLFSDRRHRTGNAPGARRVADSGRLAFDKIRSAQQEVNALYDTAQAIGTSLDLRDTFAIFSSRLLDIVPYTTCVLYLKNPDSGVLEAVYVSGRYGERFKSARLGGEKGLTHRVVDSGLAMFNWDPKEDSDAIGLTSTEQYRTAASVPLDKEGETIGALTLYSSDMDAFDLDEIRLMEALTRLASDAIANALQHERREAEALTDPLTGMANARSLKQEFEVCAGRALELGEQFLLLMMDLDGFKQVNDRVGHRAGDAVLREVARIISKQFRSQDFACRYAGDEFVGLVKSSPEALLGMARRIRRAIDSHNFGLEAFDLSIGVSIGCASFGTDGTTLEEMLNVADRAMYLDKAERKAKLSGSLLTRAPETDPFTLM